MTDVYRLHLPDVPDTATVFSSPHSGCDYGAAFLASSRLDAKAIRSSEDAFIDEVFAAAPRHGAPLLAACAPRAFIDLNRAADELDPAVIEGLARAPHNPRVASGLGVIPRVVAQGHPIYTGKLPRAEAEARIACHWHPWHGALRGLLDRTHRKFGRVLLIDCHSMPREAIPSRSQRCDVVLGDRFGTACDRAVMDRIEGAFRDAGLRTSRNAPFAGAYITQVHGRPLQGRSAVQVEIDRSLYMDEARIEKRADFPDFLRLMEEVIARLCDIGREESLSLAAE
ncbi:N-formylglutamate amidohydrolase [Falsirhodobacter deserti]|uniref:N-formylglutamate amidohydrolase n=1 Tax=Falsirhodobacter deserti TaxID=1365611 RepID=UPI000FE3EF78|nr:N-formylglutamate amidohydrolase [Falsirhodobacter deserti]